jgi:hypothetical protein
LNWEKVLSNNDLKSLMPAISLLVIVIGWFINSWLSRRHEIAKKRTELRIEVLKSFINVSKKLNFKEHEFSADEMLNVQINFLIFGYNDEIELFNSLVLSINENKPELAHQTLLTLTNLV